MYRSQIIFMIPILINKIPEMIFQMFLGNLETLLILLPTIFPILKKAIWKILINSGKRIVFIPKEI